MGRMYYALGDWVEAFEGAAWVLPPASAVRPTAGPCGEHGAHCVLVTCGRRAGHFCWGRQDPYLLAVRLARAWPPPAGACET